MLFAQTEMSLSDIHGEMQKFLSEHVTQKKLSGQIMQRAMVHFINQFDPQHVYLLKDDVEPFLTMSSSALQSLAYAVDRQDYAIFGKINEKIQEAIRKLRLFRRTMVVDIDRFRELAVTPLPPFLDADEGLVDTFSANEVELDKRHAIYMAHLVAKELDSFRAINKTLSFTEAVANVELELESYENDYLYLNKQSKPLGPKEKEHLFALHILKALTASLDVHSEYFDPKEAELLRMKLEKEYEGVGIILEQAGNSFLVGSIVKGSSADASGKIEVGDEVVSVDQTKVNTLSAQELDAALAGKVGTFVDVGFRKGSQPVYHVVLERCHTAIQEGRVDTTFEKIPGGIVGVIQLHAFYQGADGISSENDVKEALTSLAQKGAIKGLVLDLRDNRGGFLLQAVKVAGLFIKSGVIVAAKYSDGTLKYFRDTDPSVSYSGPLVVLTSKQTASAAEIVAQALKDYGVAIVVGDEQTYGKGSIQMQSVTQDKDAESYFKVTIGRYYSVSGVSTQFQGVKSDIVVPTFMSEKKVGESYLPETIKSDEIAPSFSDTLQDVDTKEKAWFEQYYLPFLQQKSDRYRKWIPDLVKRSHDRIQNNKNYQNLLRGDFYITERHGLTDEKVILDPKGALRTILNMQLQEAISITKDLIDLSR